MTMVIEIPEELNVMVPALQDLVESAKAQVERGKLGGAVDYGSFERSLCEKLNEVERQAHEAALTALDINAPAVLVGGRRYTRVLEDVVATFMSQDGGIPVSRTLYRACGERNAPTVDLVALRAGAIGGKWLPTTAQEMTFDVQQLTSREAEINGSRRGRLPYSHSSFEHVAHLVGEMYVQQQGDPEGLVDGLADDVIAILGQRPDLKVVLLCGGAHEMWNLLDGEFTKKPFDKKYVVQRLIDFWHAVEKLAPAAKIIAGSDDDAKPLLARWKMALRNSSTGAAMVLAELHASGLEHVTVGTAEPVHEAITYFTNHADKMDYAASRRRGALCRS